MIIAKVISVTSGGSGSGIAVAKYVHTTTFFHVRDFAETKIKQYIEMKNYQEHLAF